MTSDTRQTRIDPLNNLTPAEIRVFRIRATGATNAEVAEALGISEQTVKNHIQSIFRIVGARNIVEALVAMGMVRAFPCDPVGQASDARFARQVKRGATQGMGED